MASTSSSKRPPPPPPPPPAQTPCGACKFLRRKCVGGCVFAPHFGMEQGAARFAAVHKVFGASNVSKLLLHHVPAGRRHDAVLTICYEAQARLSDPVYGCVSTILALQHQVASLQAELSIVQSQLMSSRLAVASALQVSQQQAEHVAALQPDYSNNSSASNSMANINGSFPSAGLHLGYAALPSRSPQLSGPPQDDEEQSKDSVVLTSGIFHQK